MILHLSMYSVEFPSLPYLVVFVSIFDVIGDKLDSPQRRLDALRRLLVAVHFRRKNLLLLLAEQRQRRRRLVL